MNKIHLGAAALLIGAGLSLAGCDWGNHASNNASTVEPTGPATVIEFPHGFRNVAYKCDGPNMVYSLSAAIDDTLPGGLAVVPNDPRCK